MSLSLESGTSYAPMPGGAPDGQDATPVVSINSYGKFVTPNSATRACMAGLGSVMGKARPCRCR